MLPETVFFGCLLNYWLPASLQFSDEVVGSAFFSQKTPKSSTTAWESVPGKPRTLSWLCTDHTGDEPTREPVLHFNGALLILAVREAIWAVEIKACCCCWCRKCWFLQQYFLKSITWIFDDSFLMYLLLYEFYSMIVCADLCSQWFSPLLWDEAMQWHQYIL